MPADDTLTLTLTATHPPLPEGPQLRATDVPDDATLRGLSADRREALASGLARSVDGQATVGREALLHVLREAPAGALRQTLELARARRSLGGVVSRAGLDETLLLAQQVGVGDLNDLLAQSDTVAVRGLTAREAARVRENFANTLDPSTVRFHFTKGVVTSGAAAMVVGNTIHVDPTDPRWKLRSGTTLPVDPADESRESFNALLLAHEAAHVWSYQHQGSAYAIHSVGEQLAAMTTSGGDRAGAYTYRVDQPSFWAFGEEQRAMLVQDFITAQHAKAAGRPTSRTMYGGARPVDEVLTKLNPFIKQMRAAGPGESTPGNPSAVVLCLRGGLPVQDGALGALGEHTDEVVAAVGHASSEAVLEGLRARNPAEVAAGLAGVAALAAASLASREQNGTGAHSGGSAVLDQAGLPHGVELTHGPVTLGTKAEWDAPPPPHAGGAALGFGDPRFETHLGVDTTLGDAKLSTDTRATIARDGSVRSVSAEATLRAEATTVALRGRVDPARGGALLHADMGADLTSPDFSLSASTSLTASHGTVQALEARASASTAHLGVTGGALLSRPTSDAPLRVEAADVTVNATPSSGLSLSAGASFAARGLDAIEGRVSTLTDAMALSMGAHARDLTGAPTLGVDLTATERKSGVSVSVSADTKPATNETTGQVTLKVPLP
jgi:hypothetical protein